MTPYSLAFRHRLLLVSLRTRHTMPMHTSNWFLFAPLVTAMFIAMRLTQGRRDEGTTSSLFGWVHGLLATACVFVLLATILRLTLLSLIWVPVLILLMLLVVNRMWRCRRKLLLEMLTAHADRNRLATTIMLMTGEPGWIGRVGRFLEWAWKQTPVVEKLAAASRLMPGPIGRIRWHLFIRYGQSPALLPRSGSVGAPSPPQWTLTAVGEELERIAGRLFVLAPLMVFHLPVLALIRIVLPVVDQLAAELAGSNSAPTEWTSTKLDSLVPAAHPLASLLRALDVRYLSVLLTIFVMSLLTAVLFMLIFPGLLRFPGLRWLRKGYDQALAWSALTAVLPQEQDIATALEQAAAIVGPSCVAPRFHRSADLLRQGVALPHALVQGRVVSRAESQLLYGVDSAATLEWCLNHLAQRKCELLIRRASVFVQLTIVIVTALGGLIVFWGCYQLFQMLSQSLYQLL
ncbi:MAG: hypothetical protein KatS3mg111_1631 [Pirellulaceae bacterium]|nr:MAG: hypothetical protein KatS3mg111_1631 [Pirellulaceae bacterium]